MEFLLDLCPDIHAATFQLCAIDGISSSYGERSSVGVCSCGTLCTPGNCTRSRTAANVGKVFVSSNKDRAVSTSDSLVVAAKWRILTYSWLARLGQSARSRSYAKRNVVVGKSSSRYWYAAKAPGLRTSE